jgi:hypothetical protein
VIAGGAAGLSSALERAAVLVRCLSLALLMAVASDGVLAAQSPAAAAPPADAAARAAFLRTARVVRAVPIGKGVTHPFRLTLSDGRLTHDAAFQGVDERTTENDRREGRRRAGERDFVDSWRYNVAAYEIAVLLGLGDMMTVTVERVWDSRRGALSWWVDEVAMDEEERQRTGATGPDPARLSRQQQVMAVFAALLHDVDRNKGNVLYTKDWRLVMIDFTRAFRLGAELSWPIAAVQIRRDVFEHLRQLTPASIAAVASRWLTPFEIDAVVKRRDLLLAHFTRLAAARGDAAVFYE